MKIESLFNHNKRCNITRAINTFQHTKMLLRLDYLSTLKFMEDKIYLL